MQILQGTRIVSFNHYLMGPLAIQHLADLGADVIAVEAVDGAWHRHWGGANRKVDGQSVLFLAANRNKRSLAVNFKSAKGLEVMEAMGLGYDDLRREHPRLIYASASGYGQDGPYAKRPGQDLLVQVMSGLAAITGNAKDRARPAGVSIVDHHGASLFALGILAALVSRNRTGEGMRVDVDLLSAGLDLQAESLVCYFNGEHPVSINPPAHIAGWHYSAPYGIYPTRDGHIAISFAPLEKLGAALGVLDLQNFSEDDARSQREDMVRLIVGALVTRTTEEWLDILGDAGIWHAPVNDYEAVFADPQVKHNGNLLTIPGATETPIALVGHPIRYNGEAPGVRLPPQPLGAQSCEILRELGCGEPEIEEMIAEGLVIAGAPTGEATVTS